MGTVDILALLANDRNEWESLCKVLDARPRGTVHGNGPNAWNSRDVYAHIAHWLQFSNDNLEKVRMGNKPIAVHENQIEEINRRWQQEDRYLTLPEARAWAEREITKRVDLIRGMPASFWEHGNLQMVSFDGAAHYREHRNYITG
ncbi:MAG: ClbS/DfsB family four-helix bundle protein [Dehalococcoidales bacterium]|nr:ClbS/DfsB family four-helix bundle protein [Dehalococcoidales bacterium]